MPADFSVVSGATECTAGGVLSRKLLPSAARRESTYLRRLGAKSVNQRLPMFGLGCANPSGQNTRTPRGQQFAPSERRLEATIAVGYVFQFTGRSDDGLEDHAGVHHRGGRRRAAAAQRVSCGRESSLRNQFQGRLRLTDGERRSLAEIGKRLGKQALDEIASFVKPDTILGWHRRLVAKSTRRFSSASKKVSTARRASTSASCRRRGAASLCLQNVSVQLEDDVRRWLRASQRE